MRRSIIATSTIAAVLPLVACGNEPSVTATNVSVGEVAQKVADATADADFMQPGRWEGAVVIKGVTMAGMTAAQQAALAKQAGNTKHGFATCVTAEDVKARRGFFTGDTMKDCTYDRFELKGGRIDAQLTCNAGGGGVATKMRGSYGPQAYQLDLTSTIKAPAGGMPDMTSRVSVDGRRTGACRGDEANR